MGQIHDNDSGLDYLNARYYKANIGKFISQDPVFLTIGDEKPAKALSGKDMVTVLSDPQSLNSYSYGRNNPITMSDPEGKFAHIAIGAGAAIVGQYAYDVYNNIHSNGLSAGAFTHVSSAETYLVRATQGAVIAATGGIAASAGLGTLGQAVTVGVASGVTGIASNLVLGQPVTSQGALIDTAVGSVSFGALSNVAKIPGRLPNFGTKAFFVGEHTKQNALNLGFEAGINYLSSAFSSSTSMQKTTSDMREGKSTNTETKQSN